MNGCVDDFPMESCAGQESPMPARASEVQAGFVAVTDIKGFSCQSKTQQEIYQEKLKILEMRKAEYDAQQKKEVRFNNRRSIDELLGKILKGDLITIFSNRKMHFPKVPLRFEAGHMEYLKIWEKLFSYEVFSMLLNSRRSDSKDERPNTAGLEARTQLFSNSRKQYMFVGYSCLGKGNSGRFKSLRIYDRPPFSKNIAATDADTGMVKTDQLKETREDGMINDRFNLKHIKEHDLVLLSASRISTPGRDDDIKKVTSLEFLSTTLRKPDAMFGFVTGRNCGNPRDPTQSLASIDVLIDESRSGYLQV